MSNIIQSASKSELDYLKRNMSKEAYASVLDLQQHNETLKTEEKTSAVASKINDGSSRSGSGSDWDDFEIDSEGSSSSETKPAAAAQKPQAATSVYRTITTSSKTRELIADLESYNQQIESEEEISDGSNSPVISQENLKPTTMDDVLETSKAKVKQIFTSFTTSSKAALEKILK